LSFHGNPVIEKGRVVRRRPLADQYEQQVCQCETNERIKNVRVLLKSNNGGVRKKVKWCSYSAREKEGTVVVKRLRIKTGADVTLRVEGDVTEVT
jgi:hypothetical protein